MRARSFRAVTVAGIAVISLLVGAGVAVASHSFSDVPNSNIFHDDIDFLAERAITLGCGGGNYCPSDNVTREQMAAFLERTARALSPTILTERDAQTGTPSATNILCRTAVHTAPFEQVATIDAGVYVFNADVDGLVRGKTFVRVDGGAWQETNNAWNLTQSVDAGENAATHTTGATALNPGSMYEFGISAVTVPSSQEIGCQLMVTISHRMP